MVKCIKPKMALMEYEIAFRGMTDEKIASLMRVIVRVRKSLTQCLTQNFDF